MEDERSLRQRELPLLAREIMFLLDAIRNRDLDEGDELDPRKQDAIARRVVLKLAEAYTAILAYIPKVEKAETLYEVELDRERVQNVSFTEQETWLLRDKVRTGDQPPVKLGLVLMHKILESLLWFDSQRMTESLLGDDLKTAPVARRKNWTVDKRKRYQTWRESDGIAETGTGPDSGTDDDTRGLAGSRA